MMRRNLLLLLIAPVGCTSASEDMREPRTDAGTVASGLCAGDQLQSPEAELASLGRAQCERQLACNTPIVNQRTDVPGCVEALGYDEARTYFAGRNTRPNAQSACECRQFYQSAACEQLSGVTPPSCTRLWVGDGQPGDACEIAYDCAAGLVCNTSDQCPGRCAPPAAPCDVGSCAVDERCDRASGECKAELPQGAECLSGEPCRTGLYCGVSPSAPQAGFRCLPVHQPDEACTFTEGSCVAGYACQPAGGSSTCQPLRAEGESCGGASDCRPGLYCDFDVHQCSPVAQRGETCRAIAGNCAEGLSCRFPIDAACAPGQGCSLTEDCCLVDGVAACQPFGASCGELVGTCEPPDGTRWVGPLLGPGDDCARGHCPLGTVCRHATSTATISTCAALHTVGESCEDVGFNPFGCERGFCDFFGARRCVEPQVPGGPCAGDGPTLGCLTLQCDRGRCAEWSTLVCGG